MPVRYGLLPAQRPAVHQERSAPLLTELERWMIETRDKLSRGHDLTKALCTDGRHSQGMLTIDSKPETGTVVQVRVPVQPGATTGGNA